MSYKLIKRRPSNRPSLGMPLGNRCQSTATPRLLHKSSLAVVAQTPSPTHSVEEAEEMKSHLLFRLLDYTETTVTTTIKRNLAFVK
jgi:hypothetical protein